jgi:hypothetical protein
MIQQLVLQIRQKNVQPYPFERLNIDQFSAILLNLADQKMYDHALSKNENNKNMRSTRRIMGKLTASNVGPFQPSHAPIGEHTSRSLITQIKVSQPPIAEQPTSHIRTRGYVTSSRQLLKGCREAGELMQKVVPSLSIWNRNENVAREAAKLLSTVQSSLTQLLQVPCRVHTLEHTSFALSFENVSSAKLEEISRVLKEIKISGIANQKTNTIMFQGPLPLSAIASKVAEKLNLRSEGIRHI